MPLNHVMPKVPDPDAASFYRLDGRPGTASGPPSTSTYHRREGALSSVFTPMCSRSRGRSLRTRGELIGTLPNGKPDPSFGRLGYAVTPYVFPAGIWAVPISDGEVVSAVEDYVSQPYLVLPAFTANGSPALGPKGPEVARFDLTSAYGRTEAPMVDALAGPDGSVEIIVAGNHGVDMYRLTG